MKTPRKTAPFLLLGAALSIGATACLPGDTRPVPASVFVSASPTPAVRDGFDTEDGYRVTFERLVTALGDIDLERDDAECNRYAGARYDRLFDFTVAEGQKVGTVWGLGACRLRFRMRAPSFEALLGPGVTASDVASMRIRGTDRFATEQRVSLVVRGEATRAGQTTRFDWVFRQGYEITDCEAVDGGPNVTSLVLETGEALSAVLEVRGEELFRAAADDAAPLRFAPIAEADGDGDGAVTLDELSEAPYPPYALEDAGAEEPEPDATLEDLVYGELLPRVVRLAGGGKCAAKSRGGR